MANIEIRQETPTAFYIKVHDTDNAVSYTHLDVYKRQILPCAPKAKTYRRGFETDGNRKNA